LIYFKTYRPINMKATRYVYSVPVIMLILLTLYSCPKETPNRAPVIELLSFSPMNVGVGETCRITAYVTDPEDDSLTFDWNCQSGEITQGNGTRQITWLAPETPGDYIIELVVSDGENISNIIDTVSPREIPILSTNVGSLIFETGVSTKNFNIVNNGSGEFTWTASTDKSWITGINPETGVTSGATVVEVTVDRNAVTDDFYPDAILIESDAGSVMLEIILVGNTQSIFYEDFTYGDMNWSFDYCQHSVTNGVLRMEPTSVNNDPLAGSQFPAIMELPWGLRADICAVNDNLQDGYYGLMAVTNDDGEYSVASMYLAVIKNPTEGANWIWLWYMPDMEGWGIWDESCYGYSAAVDSVEGWNKLEMVALADKRFTLKCNGVNLSSWNTSVLSLESLGVDVNLGVDGVILRGGYNVETEWDNVLFYSEGTTKTDNAVSYLPTFPSNDVLKQFVGKMQNRQMPCFKEIIRERQSGRQ
jgi:hypothetical protein